MFSSTLTSTAWPGSSIYAQEVDVAPEIDGEISDNEWKTDEDTYQDTIDGLIYDQGSQTTIKLDLIALRDGSNLYLLVTVLTEVADAPGSNISVGIAFADESMDGLAMSSSFDRKVAYYNGSTYEYDLHACSQDLGNCLTIRDLTPGLFDTDTEFIAEYGETSDGRSFFEFQIPLVGDENEDILIQEGTHLRILINPYANIVDGLTGHGLKATKDLKISYSKEAFFERPEGPMEPLAVVFNSVFAIFVIAIALMFILSGRSENIAKKLWRVDVTKEMANKSILMEIAYYNSSFLSMFALFFFMLYSLIAFVYGFWANWGLPGALINGIPTVLSIYAFIDLAKRNYNPQDMTEEEAPRFGKNMEKSGALWIIPPLFLGLVLFMLVFIGIDVIS
ncbi:MAG: hypothetical protein ACXAD7_14690 [Candidatus Kariarchaeaceae archaeon]|jgi:hypothetical protein